MMPIYVDAANASSKRHDELARGMTAQLQSAGVTAEAERRDGDAATEILAAATVSKADLIVMGTHGRTGLKTPPPRQCRSQRAPASGVFSPYRPGGRSVSRLNDR